MLATWELNMFCAAVTDAEDALDINPDETAASAAASAAASSMAFFCVATV